MVLVIVLGGCHRDPNVVKQKYFESGTRYFHEEKYREAAIEFQNALKADPDYADAHYQLAQCDLKLQILNGAYTELNRTVELAPKNSKARVDLGNLLLVGREYVKAEEQARIVLKAEPNNADAHILLANTYAGHQQLSSALDEMALAIRLAPNRSESYLNLAAIEVYSRQFKAAEESYKKAVALDPKSATPAMALGYFYGQQGRWDEAEQEFRHAMELDPKSVQPRGALARVLLVRGEKAKAEQTLKEAKQALGDNPDAYRMLADFYVLTGQLDKALAEYASLYEQHPGDLRAKKNYVQLLIDTHRLDQATKLNDEILKANPKDVDGMILRGQVLRAQGHFQEAVQILSTALQLDAGNAVAHYQLGLCYNALGNAEQGEQELRNAVGLRPDVAEGQRALAGMALVKMDIETVRNCADAIIKAQPFAFDGYLYRGISELARKDESAAETDFKRAIELAPDNPNGYLRLGGLRDSQNRYKEAEQLYEQALARDPNFLMALVGLADLYDRQSQLPKALARVNEQIAKAPNNSGYYTLLGKLLVGEKDMTNAQAAFQKAVALNKNETEAILYLAQLQEAQGSVSPAMANYQLAIQQNPRYLPTYVLLGVLEQKQGDWQKAEDSFQKALQVDRNYSPAANNLAYLMLEHGGNIDVALGLAQTARQGSPDSPYTAGTLAWAYYQKGAYKLAIDLLEEAAKQMPGNPEFQYHLGMAYLKSKDKPKAREHLQRVLKLDPKFSQAGDVRKALDQLVAG